MRYIQNFSEKMFPNIGKERENTLRMDITTEVIKMGIGFSWLREMSKFRHFALALKSLFYPRARNSDS
jgi:hypothetical protein